MHLFKNMVSGGRTRDSEYRRDHWRLSFSYPPCSFLVHGPLRTLQTCEADSLDSFHSKFYDSHIRHVSLFAWCCRLGYVYAKL